LIDVAGGQDAHRKRQHERQQRTEGGDVQRFDQRVMHGALVVGKVDRPHPREEIDDLVRRVGKKFGNHFDRLDRHRNRGDEHEVDREAR